jgi:hypothetical protein
MNGLFRLRLGDLDFDEWIDDHTAGSKMGGKVKLKKLKHTKQGNG